MGCLQSTPDPNDMYGTDHENIRPYSSKVNKDKKTNKVHPVSNGLSNGNVKNKMLDKKPMKGDASMYREAKFIRERKLRESLLRREQLAKEMSDKVMEEKERLSLTSGRSRATSRATSPRSGRYTTRTIRDVSLGSLGTPSHDNDMDHEMRVVFSQDLDKCSGVSFDKPGTSQQSPPMVVKQETSMNDMKKIKNEKSESQNNEQIESETETISKPETHHVQASVIEEESLDESFVIESGLKEDEPGR